MQAGAFVEEFVDNLGTGKNLQNFMTTTQQVRHACALDGAGGGWWEAVWRQESG